MRIVIPYFEPETQIEGQHRVYRDMLRAWQYSYDCSGTTLPVYLLTDSVTPPIHDWRHGVVVCPDADPPYAVNVLNKVGWLKHQAFKLMGRSLVMDLDAFPQKNLDYMSEIDCSIAMTPDPGEPKTWQWRFDWPEAARKYNAGVMILNDERIYTRFRELWLYKKIWIPGVTYFDELIFTAMMVEYGGVDLTDKENCHAGYAYEEAVDPAVLHFSGMDRKEALDEYVKSRAGLSAYRL